MKKINISICFILMLLIPSTIVKPDTLDDVMMIDDLPDLIVTDIIIEEDWWHPLEYLFIAKIKNIGNSPAPKLIETHTIVKRLLFGFFPIGTVFNETYSFNIATNLAPGETFEVELCRGYEIPSGFNIVYCTVNPNHTIEETSYFNNKHSDKFFGFICWKKVRW